MCRAGDMARVAGRPKLSVLFISGCMDRGSGGGVSVRPDMNFLQKPFRSDVLGRKLRDLLES